MLKRALLLAALAVALAFVAVPAPTASAVPTQQAMLRLTAPPLTAYVVHSHWGDGQYVLSNVGVIPVFGRATMSVNFAPPSPGDAYLYITVVGPWGTDWWGVSKEPNPMFDEWWQPV